MKKLALALAVAISFPALAAAETLAFPSDAPVAAITIPDDWNPTETESGIEANSPDAAIYFSIDVADAEASDKVISDAVDFLSENGVTIDAATQKESDDELNGMQMKNLDWDGKDADGPVSIGLSIVAPSPEKLLIVTYWGSKETQGQHAEALTSMITSLKPAN